MSGQEYPRTGGDVTAHTPAATATMQEQGSIPLALVVLGVAVYLTYGIVTMQVSPSASPPGPRFFPAIVAGLAYLIGVLLIVQAMRARRAAHGARTGSGTVEADRTVDADAGVDVDAGADAPQGTASGAADGEAPIDWRGVVIVSATLVVFMVALVPVGWLISGAFLFTGVAYGLGARNLLVSAGAGLALSSAIQLAFSGGLGLPLPAGILGAW
ncbi:MAG: tripartite tricarboxylate transporter TctB family protein [Actinomycetales bacterium]